MQAAVRDIYGSPDVVRVEELPTPTPTDDQVLVRVHAASVNRADLDNLYPRWAFIRLLLGLRRPRNRRIGLDAAGVVEAVGPAVTRTSVGDRVFGDLYDHGLGALADYVCTDERAFLPIPDSISFEDAATLPHSAVLALQGLRRGRRTVAAGERVLVIGASGNVGPFAVQIARAAGAHVTGTARSVKVPFVRSLGVDEVVDYTTTDPLSGGPYDWILDVDGNVSMSRAKRALRPGGVYQTLGGSGWAILRAIALGPFLSLASGGRHVGLMLGWKPFAEADVTTLTAMLQAGTLTPAIDSRYPLSAAADALRRLDDGHAQGKVLVIPVRTG
jgi:NADPH:quinone reductase-like Zn-dependent oxidoreductase